MKEVVEKLYDLIWSKGQLELINTLVAPTYKIHSDPGDAWEGQSLDHETYKTRVMYSSSAFPDLAFKLQHIVAENGLVAVTWSAHGTHKGDLTGLPATGRKVEFKGQTIYEVKDGMVCGHWQTIDRLGFIQQFQGPPKLRFI